MKRWQKLSFAEVIMDVLNDSSFCGESLLEYPGLDAAVTEKLNGLMNIGAKQTIQLVQSKNKLNDE